jgi:hypothetical protein
MPTAQTLCYLTATQPQAFASLLLEASPVTQTLTAPTLFSLTVMKIRVFALLL